MGSLSIIDSLEKRDHPLASPHKQLAMLDGLSLAREFDAAIASTPMKTLRSKKIDIFQLNVGKLCNQTCRHCHVDAGPDRTEVMPDDVVDKCLSIIESEDFGAVDITGGAPELHPRFEEMVTRSRAAGKRVMDRCNLTILEVKKYAHLPRFFAEHGVEIVASLPFHSESFVDAQRGKGVYEKSIAALKKLNDVGYGKPGSGLTLTLVSNPVGAFLPASQGEQESQYKKRLKDMHGVEFNQLFTITNMPISRYLEWLEESGNLVDYMKKLVGAFNPAAAEGVMCRNTISIGWDGVLYDCDFNQMLELGLAPDQPRTVFDWDRVMLDTREVRVARHCFGCTAGQGSSCGGATA